MKWKVRDSCGKSEAKGDPTGPRTTAESECLEWKSTFEFTNPK
ncbi:hypothetical protein RCO48_30280 [Peribacillus frigoritolerans]|nr:hypothetical protein [Peribacillus frigoritolerans]